MLPSRRYYIVVEKLLSCARPTAVHIGREKQKALTLHHVQGLTNHRVYCTCPRLPKERSRFWELSITRRQRQLKVENSQWPCFVTLMLGKWHCLNFQIECLLKTQPEFRWLLAGTLLAPIWILIKKGISRDMTVVHSISTTISGRHNEVYGYLYWEVIASN